MGMRRPFRRIARFAVAGALLALAPAAGSNPSLTRDEVRQAEQWLADLGFWAGPIDGVWDGASRHALVAFQKIEGARPTGRLTRAEWNALSVARPPAARFPDPGPRLEVDVARQVLLFVDAEGRAGNILPISSGNGKRFREAGYPAAEAVTPCARLEVYKKLRGWRKSPLGEMYNPLYIVGGIAIHGSPDVPPHPASHGCVRIPMFAADRLFALVAVGTPVHVYGCAEG
jgi:hypothetical protein